MLRIYNSLTRRSEIFEPITPGKIGIYVCGMTVYDYCHLGHARVMVVFDMVIRYLRSRGYDVTYVRNITDIDDKIINRANENQEEYFALTNRFIQAMHEDEEALGVLRPDLEPRATDTIADIVEMIESLIDRGYAYPAENGDVYYRVGKFETYGRLSGKQVADLRVGARVEIGEAKDDPLDFVLWKAAKPKEPSWPSPWGDGRPGWHIECSAMSKSCLGNHFDIHGGGMDLQFPHHENEIAQSEAANEEKFVNVWMHNGFVRINDEKMAKSLGNFFTVREVLEKYPAEAVRYFMITSQYRSPLNYSEEHLDHARNSLERLYTALRGIEPEGAPIDEFLQRFDDAMDDDFNSPKALAVLFDIAKALNRERAGDAALAGRLAGTLRHLGAVLGLLEGDPEAFLHGETETGSAAEIEAMIEQRNRARKGKDWAEADRLRDALTALGVELEDGAKGTIWRRR